MIVTRGLPVPMRDGTVLRADTYRPQSGAEVPALLLRTPYDSSDFMHWGHGGLGQWITVYTNPGHAFVQIAGIRFDTSREADPHPAPGTGPRWRPVWGHPSGFASRHPSGF